MALKVLLTAGASGIGRAIAESFCADGAQVHLCDIDETALANLPSGAVGSAVDLVDDAALDAWLDSALADLGGCDVLINNAGVAGQAGAIEDLDLDAWRASFAVNLEAQMLTCRKVIPVMKDAGSGSIINISSTAGLFAVPYRAPYVAAKWAVIGLTKTIASETGQFGIRCNAICPGSVDGDRMARVITAESKASGRSEADVRAQYTSGVSMRRFAQPEEMADLCKYLASDAARFISGQAIAVDGNTETYASG